VLDQVKQLLAGFDQKYCTDDLKLPVGCLNKEVGKTNVDLVGEELMIRKYETNLGDWLADQALNAFRADGAQISILNAGSIRLNEDIPAGSIRLQHFVEIFQYNSPLRLVRITGRSLQEIVDHSVSNWNGAGYWLQVGGFAFMHNPKQGKASGLKLVLPGNLVPVDDAMSIKAVVPEFLLEGSGRDGYGFKFEYENGTKQDFRKLIEKAFAQSLSSPINEKPDGRICNESGYPDGRTDHPCLARSVKTGQTAALAP
jgi:2',3'-cyclic-nucleotide 2'-phosphodiesterase (5'-nucleotidase family)